jgi:hypothetical protein
LDNGSFHKAKKLDVPSNVYHIFLPPYSPQLNPIERFWQDLKQKMAEDQFVWPLHEHLSDLMQLMRGRLPPHMQKRRWLRLLVMIICWTPKVHC